MGRTFSEADFADKAPSPAAPRTFSASDFADTKDAVAQPRQASDSGEALLTNLPTQGFGQDMVRGLPATGGAMMGAASGAALGTAVFPGVGTVVGGILGAGLGGMSGESVRQAVAQGTAAAFAEQNYPINRPSQVLKDVGIQGATQAAGEAGGQVLAAGGRFVRPYANKLGAQMMRVGAGIPEKAGEAAMRNPSVLLDAQTPEVAKEAYRTFEKYTGLRGLDEVAGARAKPWSANELYEFALNAANKVKEGAKVSPQELYTASQAENQLSRLAKYGNPDAAAMLGSQSLREAGSVADKALGSVYPEYSSLRSGYAASKTANEFTSLLPLNKNQSPNVLRSVVAGREAAVGAAAIAGVGMGHPAALAALPLISPKFYGAGLQAAALVGKIPAGVYRLGIEGGAGASGSALQAEYLRRGISQPDPNFAAIGGRMPVAP